MKSFLVLFDEQIIKLQFTKSKPEPAIFYGLVSLKLNASNKCSAPHSKDIIEDNFCMVFYFK